MNTPKDQPFLLKFNPSYGLFLEALSSLCLSPNEFRILLVIMRKTWFFGKPRDRISLSQFESMTGIKERNASRAISSLKKIGIITASRGLGTDNPRNDPVTYEFNYKFIKIVSDDGVLDTERHKSFLKKRHKRTNLTGVSLPPLSPPSLSARGLGGATPKTTTQPSPETSGPDRQRGKPTVPFRPLTRDPDAKELVGITKDLARRWMKAYPDINVLDQLILMEEKIEEKGYHTNDWNHFVENWLAKAQRKAAKKRRQA